MTDFVMMCCGECGIEFQVPDFFQEERKKTGKGWHCPNGHPRVYRESDADRFRRERDRALQQIAERDDMLAAKDREIKRIKKRAASGTCPCCQRSFGNMALHMKRQHPEYVKETGANVVQLKRGAIQ